MKIPMTVKELRHSERELRCCGANDMQHLLKYHDPVGYNAGSLGWNFDVYYVYGLHICTGYRRTPGEDLKETGTFEEKARLLHEKYRFVDEEADRCETEALLREFCLLNGGIENDV